MFTINMGFKKELFLVITLSFLSYAAIAVLTLLSLNRIDLGFLSTEQLNRTLSASKDLHIQLLTAGQSASAELDPLQASANQLKQQLSSNPETSEQLTESQALFTDVKHWSQLKQQITAQEQQIGETANTGYRGETANALAEIEKVLFSNLKTEFDHLEAAILQAGEHKQPLLFQQTTDTLKAFESAVKAIEFEDLYAPKIAALSVQLERLGTTSIELSHNQQLSLKLYHNISQQLTQLENSLGAELKQARLDVNGISSSVRNILLTLSAIMALITAGLLIHTSRRIIHRLDQMSGLFRGISQGDLTKQIEVPHIEKDALDSTLSSIGSMTTSLNQLLHAVVQESAQLKQQTESLDQVCKSLSEHGTDTHSQSENMVALTEQINHNTQAIVQSGLNTQQQSSEMQDAVLKGESVIQQTLQSMTQLTGTLDKLSLQINDLDDASKQVNGMTEMINTIAEQTNLLALNAAIEAARAGESGRGFAVVADEVRELASRTVEATQHIADVTHNMQSGIQALLNAMSESASHIDQSQQLGQDASLSLQQIRTVVHQSMEANKELNAQIESIATAVTAMSNSVYAISGSVTQSQQLNQTVDDFVSQCRLKSESLLHTAGQFKCTSPNKKSD